MSAGGRRDARGGAPGTLRRFRPQILVWIGLIALLGATWGLAYVQMGLGNLLAALGIAAAKLLLVALVFMELRAANALLRLSAAAGLVFLTIMLALTFADVAVRLG